MLRILPFSRVTEKRGQRRPTVAPIVWHAPRVVARHRADLSGRIGHRAYASAEVAGVVTRVPRERRDPIKTVQVGRGVRAVVGDKHLRERCGNVERVRKAPRVAAGPGLGTEVPVAVVREGELAVRLPHSNETVGGVVGIARRIAPVLAGCEIPIGVVPE